MLILWEKNIYIYKYNIWIFIFRVKKYHFWIWAKNSSKFALNKFFQLKTQKFRNLRGNTFFSPDYNESKLTKTWISKALKCFANEILIIIRTKKTRGILHVSGQTSLATRLAITYIKSHRLKNILNKTKPYGRVIWRSEQMDDFIVRQFLKNLSTN